jgi:predicted lipoprotein with Yx(FWY)xxD motif
MKSKLRFTHLLVFVLLGPACAPTPRGTPTALNTPFIPVTGNTAATTATVSGTLEAPTGTQAPTQTQPATATATGVGSVVTLMVSTEGDAAPYLVDDRGRSLYVYMNDTQNSQTSACVDDCAVEWPPLTVSVIPAAGQGVDATLIGTMTRENGFIQATYNGRPLYYYNMDTLPGTTNGQTYKGVWFLVSPEGEPIQR